MTEGWAFPNAGKKAGGFRWRLRPARRRQSARHSAGSAGIGASNLVSVRLDSTNATGRSNDPSVPTFETLAIFCDFDGTFSVQDVGATLGQKYRGDARAELWARFEAGELDAWGYAHELIDGLELSESELEEFLRTIVIDPGAARIVDWCTSNGVPFEILSDGFDYNLEKLMSFWNVHFEYRANHLQIREGRMRISPGHRNEDCSCGTGSCKRGIIRRYRLDHPGAFCVHIGNGRVSDLCGAFEADLAYAKDTLGPALRSHGEAYVEFDTLNDVVDDLVRRLEGQEKA